MQKKETLQAIITDLDRAIKMLVRKDFELSGIKEKREAELMELDHIAKLLVRRDLELTQIKERREDEFQELEERTKELEESKQALLNILEDVEESRMLAEEEKNKTLALIANFSDGVLFFDSKNKLSLANIKVQDFFNIKPDEIIGSSLEELNKFESLKTLISLISSGLKILAKTREELVLGSSLVLEVSTVSIELEEQKLGTLLILHDITREKSVERLKTEFVAIAAHQLRTPLSAIKWTLRMFLDGDIGDVSETQSEFLQKTYDSNERMINLVNDLLNVTRIEEGKFLQKTQKCNIVDLLKEAAKSIEDIIMKKNLNFNLVLPDKNSPELNMDKEKIILAIQNLLENAVSYTKIGEVILSGAYDIAQKRFLIKVQDSGIGIPKEQHTRVFSRFFRSSNALKTETEGTGLGLFIAKNIIEAHGGKIWFESVEGKGTTFYFTLPA
ncbi:MAG: ATP-binding protein [bacterium]|nr:ATP-binding protein [bacterium]